MIFKKLFPNVFFIYFFQYEGERNLNYFDLCIESFKKNLLRSLCCNRGTLSKEPKRTNKWTNKSMIKQKNKQINESTSKSRNKQKKVNKQLEYGSALIWKKTEERVFNWSEVHLSEVTSYKIHTLGFYIMWRPV